MLAGLRSRWQQIKQYRVAIGFIAVLVVAIALISVEVRAYGTGFAGKTLWDWFNLLGVLAIPVAVGFGAAWFTHIQHQRDQKLAEQRAKSEREVAEKRAQTEREIALDDQRDAALREYIDKMSELLLEKQLRESQPEDEVRNIARVRTLTVVPRLDADRKANVLRFG